MTWMKEAIMAGLPGTCTRSKPCWGGRWGPQHAGLGQPPPRCPRGSCVRRPGQGEGTLGWDLRPSPFGHMLKAHRVLEGLHPGGRTKSIVGLEPGRFLGEVGV